MANFTKATFKSIAKGGKAVETHEGYEFTAFAIEGNLYKMYVHQADDKTWRVVDPMSGRKLCEGATRAKAVENATTPEMVRNFANMVKLDKYAEYVDEFIDLCGGKKPELKPEPKAMPKPKAKPKAAKKAKAPAKPKAPSKPKAKAAEPKAEPTIVELFAELAKVKQELADLKAGKLTAEQQATAKAISDAAMAAETVSLSELLAEMQGWCKSHDNVIAERRSGGLACVRILGVKRNDEATKKELADKGFRWSKKGFWYYGETEARKQGKVAIA